MKRYLFAIFCLFALLSSCEEINVPEDKPDTPEKTYDPASPRGSDYLYDLSVVSEVKLSISHDDWNTFLTNFDLNPDNNTYIPATFSFKKGSDRKSVV